MILARNGPHWGNQQPQPYETRDGCVLSAGGLDIFFLACRVARQCAAVCVVVTFHVVARGVLSCVFCSGTSERDGLGRSGQVMAVGFEYHTLPC